MAFFSRWHNAAVRAQTNKFVRCEQCAAQYVYGIDRVGVGQEISILHLENEHAKNLAADYAEADLSKQLQEGCEPVPCPLCGWYQAAMCVRAKDLYGLPMWRFGGALLIIGAFLLLALWLVERTARNAEGDPIEKFVMPLSVASIVFVLGGALIVYLRWEGKAKYNPNDAPQVERIQLGRLLALTFEEFNERGNVTPTSPPKNYSAFARPRQT